LHVLAGNTVQDAKDAAQVVQTGTAGHEQRRPARRGQFLNCGSKHIDRKGLHDAQTES
jgi:hypothetical protein